MSIIFNRDDHTGIWQSLQDQGYAVVRIDTLDGDRVCQQFIHDLKQINDYLDIAICSARESSPAELLPALKEGVDYPTSAMHGLLGEYGLSQGTSAWTVRLDPTIQSVFTDILSRADGSAVGLDDIVCSMDAIGFSSAVHARKVAQRRWLHVDQNPHIPGSEISSYQGIYYAHATTGEQGAGTMVVPGSHSDHLSHDYRVIGGSHFQVVDQDRYWDKAVKLDVPAGCLLVYSSKLVHQGWYGISRLCYMVSYGLKRQRSEDARIRKIMMYLGGHRSTHWSQFGQYHGWKWQHGENWDLAKPRLADGVTDECKAVAGLLLEEEKTSVDLYRPEMDSYIPQEILRLL